jgi:hypothetical protein
MSSAFLIFNLIGRNASLEVVEATPDVSSVQNLVTVKKRSAIVVGQSLPSGFKIAALYKTRSNPAVELFILGG